MQAKIELKGSQMEGYEVNISLPVQWLKMWHSRANVTVGGLPLWTGWGEKRAEAAMRCRTIFCSSFTDAKECVKNIEEQIEEAKKFAASVVKTEEIEVIEL